MPPSRKRCVQCTADGVDMCTHCLCPSCAFCEVRVARRSLVICGKAREGGSSGGQRCRSCRRARNQAKSLTCVSRATTVVDSMDLSAAITMVQGGFFVPPPHVVAPAGPSATTHPEEVAAADIMVQDARPECPPCAPSRTRPGTRPERDHPGARRSCRVTRQSSRRGGVDSMSAVSEHSEEANTSAGDDVFTASDSTLEAVCALLA